MSRGLSDCTPKEIADAIKKRKKWELHISKCRKEKCAVCQPHLYGRKIWRDIMMDYRRQDLILRGVNRLLAKDNLKLVVANKAGEVLFKIVDKKP